ncbi:type VI secretion system tube protein TssD [Hymenobacter artigasi]|uniref:Uncharacterized protein n=1 Tax=Hymenobacter artigasi TaxID=2719616 RepID=A0ABX1HNA4_9BACT|nr:type VI secretion system tube protein TssD [Hymenobacter artigasi]NKI91379.1 hypothetical protein [Hymenobacter artigasi]
MASFSAELHVAGFRFPILHCHYGVHQATHQRGRVSTKVRHEPVHLTLSVPDEEALLAWAAEAQKRQAAAVVFRDASGGSPVETLALGAAYCVSYQEEFVSGDVNNGAYVCHLVLSDPDGFTIQAGGPATAFVAPAAREHGVPGAALLGVAIGGAASAVAVNPDIPSHLPAPVPVPSPNHQQLHLTATEWQTLVKDRWDGSKEAKNKRFLAQHRSTEFHIAGDPFIYRTDATGKMEAVYDAQKSYNVTGSKNGLMGIPLTLNGEPTYAGTPHMFPVTGNQKNVVQIKMAGTRPGDFTRANKEAGLTDLVKSQGLKPNKPPKGYTWHHRDDFEPKSPPNPPYGTCTMELVKTQAHKDTFVHFGSCDQCNQHFAQPLYV